MNSLGTYQAGDTLNLKFTTVDASAAPITLGGTPAISVYKDNSVTQSTSGVTLSVDFDSVTGLHNVNIDTSSDGSFYADGSSFQVVITTGTVDSISVVGTVVGDFRLTTTKANLTQVAGSDITTLTGAYPALGIVDSGTAQSATSTTLVLRSAAAFADGELVGAVILITGGSAGVGQRAVITGYAGSTDTATVDTWTTTPTGTITYIVFAGAPASSGDLSDIAAAVLDDPASSHTDSGSIGERIGRIPNAPAGSSGGLPTVDANNLVAGIQGTANTADDIITAILTTALTESYAADGAAGTLSQILFGIQAWLQERSVSGTTVTVKELDGSTTAMTFTLDDGTTPTSITRAT